MSFRLNQSNQLTFDDAFLVPVYLTGKHTDSIMAEFKCNEDYAKVLACRTVTNQRAAKIIIEGTERDLGYSASSKEAEKLDTSKLLEVSGRITY